MQNRHLAQSIRSPPLRHPPHRRLSINPCARALPETSRTPPQFPLPGLPAIFFPYPRHIFPRQQRRLLSPRRSREAARRYHHQNPFHYRLPVLAPASAPHSIRNLSLTVTFVRKSRSALGA